MARTGARVTGVDISPRSIGHAREQAREAGLPVEYILSDYLRWEPTGEYVLATLIMCDYCAFSPNQRAELLGRMAGWLAPGSAFLFDVYSQAYYETWEEQVAYGPGLMDGFWSASPYYGFLNTFRYDDDSVALEKYTIVEQGSITEYFDWFAHFDAAGLTREVEAAGLVLDQVLGDVAGEAFDPTLPEFAVVARRPAL
jgi:SAM-dependent methyltransferase